MFVKATPLSALRTAVQIQAKHVVAKLRLFSSLQQQQHGSSSLNFYVDKYMPST